MLKFNIIEKNGIFTSDFKSLTKNNEILFPSGGEEIVVVYGPNGTGKTSLVKVLSGSDNSKIMFEFEGKKYTDGSEVFHVINDQNYRNIILGDTKDFLIGDNIKKEYELSKEINEARNSVINNVIAKLKSDYNISTISNPLLSLISDQNVAKLIKDFVNNKSKGKNYETNVIFGIFETIKFSKLDLLEEQKSKMNFLKSDLTNKDSIIDKIEKLAKKALNRNSKVYEIEENTEAIRILNRFQKDQCIVCDTIDINRQELLNKKESNRIEVLEALDKDVQELIHKILPLVSENDPFKIRQNLLEAISNGDIAKIEVLTEDFKSIKNVFEKQLLNDISSILKDKDILDKIKEYQKLLLYKPEITDEDMLYIEEIINNSMGKKLTIEHDNNKNIVIKLSNSEFLGKAREDLQLSTGEQNFLSLTFEFLKAKNSLLPIVIIDDPISSFDSIFKNKVVFAIIKMLHNKKRIILTHNTDLLRLLEGQFKNCYKLYLLNNTENEVNGFIPLGKDEQDMLINLHVLLTTFREVIPDYINDMNLFLISMIPFMRGYAKIKNEPHIGEELTKVMHGYMSDKVDIASIYINLFGNIKGKIPNSHLITVSDILSTNMDSLNILDNNHFPLLDKTLRHSLTYLFLRLLVENKLVQKFKIDTNKNKQLGQIISAAYPDSKDFSQIRNRIKLTSKKTLINEFNHFEGNLSIFQPAIDISDHSLVKEYSDVMSFISELD